MKTWSKGDEHVHERFSSAAAAVGRVVVDHFVVRLGHAG